MNGIAQNNRNSLLHKELRYGTKASFDGVCIGRGQEFLEPIGLDPAKPQKNFLRQGLLGLPWARRPAVPRLIATAENLFPTCGIVELIRRTGQNCECGD